jgi:hypothetical protein
LPTFGAPINATKPHRVGVFCSDNSGILAAGYAFAAQ